MKYKPIPCGECETIFTPVRFDQKFCCKVCKNASRNRSMLRGSELYRVAYHWRKSSGKKKGSFADMTWLVDQWIREDKAAGQCPPPLPATGQRLTDEVLTRADSRKHRAKQQEEVQDA